MIYISMMILGIVIGMCVGLTVRKHKTGYGYFKVVVMEDQPDLATVNVRIPTDQDLELLGWLSNHIVKIVVILNPIFLIKVIRLFQNTILLFAAKMIRHVHTHATN